MKLPLPLVALLLVPASLLCAESYLVKDLGTLGGTTSYSTAISSTGKMVGSSSIKGDTTTHAVRFSGTGTQNTDLGTFGGSYGSAHGINTAGQIVGQADLADGVRYRATLFSGTGGGNTDLGSLAAPGVPANSSAQSINTAGRIVGYAASGTLGNAGILATLFSGTGDNNINLGTLGGTDSQATSINDKGPIGQIVGHAKTLSGQTHATLFSGTGTNNTNLGTLGGDNSYALDINNSGQIVGHASLSNNSRSHATLFSGTGSDNTDLGTLGGKNSFATAIDDSGRIVGAADIDAVFPTSHGFIYQDGKMTDLNDLIEAPDVVISVATDINAAGQIAAYGIVNGITRAFRLDPAPVPVIYRITATANPKEKGSVQGAGKFTKGKKITLTAKTKSGSKFVKWTENGKSVSTSRIYTFKVTKARKLVAHFK